MGVGVGVGGWERSIGTGWSEGWMLWGESVSVYVLAYGRYLLIALLQRELKRMRVDIFICILFFMMHLYYNIIYVIINYVIIYQI